MNSTLIQVETVSALQRDEAKPTLVFIAGWASASSVWHALVEKFKQHYDCVIWTLPGCSAQAWNGDFELTNLLDSAQKHLPAKCVLVGWSLGGMLATQLASREKKKVQGFITFATNLQFVADVHWPSAMPAETFEAFAQSFTDDPESCLKRFQALQYKGDARARELKQYFRQAGFNFSPKNYSALQTLLLALKTLSNLQVLETLPQSAIHFFGANDALVPLVAANAIAQRQGSTQSVVIFSECGHLPHLSRQLEVLEKIENFLDSMTANPYDRDKKKIAQAFSAAAKCYDSAASLQKSCANTLLQFVDSGCEMKKVLDIGCGTGFVSEALVARQALDTLLLLDLSELMLQEARKKLLPYLHLQKLRTLDTLCMDMDVLDLQENSLDLVVSNMSMQWSENPRELLSAVWKALKPGASFVFSTVGRGTLKELNDAWKKVDDYVHVNDFLDQKTLLGLVAETGFMCEVHQREAYRQYFPRVVDLMKSLKTVGAHNVNAGQNRGLTGRARLSALEKHYETFRTNDGLPASWYVHYLQLRKPYEH